MIFLALIYLAFISLGLPDSLLGSSWPMMQAEYGVPVGNAGFVSIIVSTGTVISSLLSHKVIAKIGTGKVTAVSVALTAVALLGFAKSPSFGWLLALALPLGLGAGAVDAGLNEFVAEHYKARHMNWLHCFWGVGAMLGPIFLSALSGAGYGWRTGYMGISIIQFGLVGLLLLSLPMWRKFDKKKEIKLPDLVQTVSVVEPNNKKVSPLKIKGAVFALLTFFLYTSLENSMMLWGASYLVKLKDVTAQSAAGLVSLFFLGITAGRALSGIISAKADSRALIRWGAVIVIIGLVLMLIPLRTGFSVAGFVIVGLGLAPIFPSMLHQTPQNFRGSNAQAAMGLQMASAYIGITLMPPLFGQVFSRLSFAFMPYILLACGAGILIFSERLAFLRRREDK